MDAEQEVKPLHEIRSRVTPAQIGFRATVTSSVGSFGKTFMTERAAHQWILQISTRKVELLKEVEAIMRGEVLACTS